MSDRLDELRDELRILQSSILRCPRNAAADERVSRAFRRMDEIIREIESIEGVNPAGESKMDTLPELPPLTPPSDDPPTRPGTPEPSAQEFCDECGGRLHAYTQHGCGIGAFGGGSAYDSSSPPPTPRPSTPPPRTPARQAVRRNICAPRTSPRTPNAPTREECQRRSPPRKKRRLPTKGAAAAKDASTTKNTHSVDLRF